MKASSLSLPKIEGPLGQYFIQINSSNNIFELLDNLYTLFEIYPSIKPLIFMPQELINYIMKISASEKDKKTDDVTQANWKALFGIIQFVQTIFPSDSYGDFLSLLQERAFFREQDQYYLPGNFGNSFVWGLMFLSLSPIDYIAAKAQFLTRFCHFLLTHHEVNYFKRLNYYQELLAHDRSKETISSTFSSPYKKTIYLNREEREKFRIFITANGQLCKLIFKAGEISLLPFETDKEDYAKTIVVLTPQGEIFSTKKTRYQYQHSSFTAGGPVLFAGDWVVKNGYISTIRCEAGHYEPSISSFQNLLRFLRDRGAPLSDETKCLYIDRTYRQLTRDLGFRSISYTTSQLLGPQIQQDRTIDSSKDSVSSSSSTPELLPTTIENFKLA